MPKISVIIVSFNSENIIEATLKSVINQSYKDFELVLVDENSKDKTLEIAGNYKSHINKWISEPGKNRYDSFNKGILLAQGEYILFLNAGDILFSENALEKISNFLNNADIIYTNIELYSKKTNTHKKYNPLYNKKYMLIEAETFLQAEFIRRDLLENTGGFDLRYKFLADKEFNLRTILQESAKLKYVNETVVSKANEIEILPPQKARRIQKEKSVLRKTYCSKAENFINKILFFIFNKN